MQSTLVPRVFKLWASIGILTSIVATPASAAVPSEKEPSLGHDFGIATPKDRDRRLTEKQLMPGNRVAVRIFKAEAVLELWMEKGAHYERFATYPICYFSGALGPKRREGDRQGPEGFYTVGKSQLYLKGRLPRSFNIGFPNAFDRSNGATGSAILVHGGCESIGCYAMTDPVMDEIFFLINEALQQGQDEIPVHVFPFRLTESNLAAYAHHPWHGFWSRLKEAYDLFEETRIPPRVSVCSGRYVVRDGAFAKQAFEPAVECSGGPDPLPAPSIIAALQKTDVAVMRGPAKFAQNQQRRPAARAPTQNLAAARKPRVASYYRRAAVYDAED